MKILALELSTARGSAAWKGENATTEETWPNDRKNSGPFFAAIKAMVEKHGAPETIIVGLGPGSYAGVRIAISTAIGLQAASQARLVGVPSICAMQTNARRFNVIGDARRETFFFARIEDRRLMGEPELMSASDLAARLASMGEPVPVISSDKLSQFDGIQFTFPSAALLVELAQDVERNFSLPPLQPMYLREPHVTQAKRVAGSISNS
jgi:tRNA threonylcarbamoyl adenosine modification protein YeaZ